MVKGAARVLECSGEPKVSSLAHRFVQSFQLAIATIMRDSYFVAAETFQYHEYFRVWNIVYKFRPGGIQSLFNPATPMTFLKCAI